MAVFAAGLALVAGLVVVGWYVAATRVETPSYAVERSEGPFELRRYPSLVAAGIDRDGNREAAVRSAFSPLARYIFARDREGAKIAMTAPVTQEPAGEGWRVRFLMPAGLSLDSLPMPAGPVALEVLPPKRLAAMRFSGRWTDSAFEGAAARLAAWMGTVGLEPAGPPAYAYYNDPFTPAFLRRNEVLVPVAD